MLARTRIEPGEQQSEEIRNRLNLLLASAFAEVQRRGSITKGLQFDANALNQLGDHCWNALEHPVDLSVITLRATDTADAVLVEIQPTR